jgi:hypothetical protein
MSLAAAGLSAESNNPQTLEEGAEEAAAKEDEESVEHLYGLSSHQDSNCVTFIASLLPFSSSKYVPSRHSRIDSSRHLEKIFSLPSVRFSTRPVTAHYFARNQSLRHSPLPLDCKKERTSQYFMQINIHLVQTLLPLCRILSLLSSSSAPLPVGPLARSMLGFKTSCHLLRH